jgi:signal transduction histidine kinase
MFKVSARTILELGSELISSDIIALYELIKNGFDAGSTNGVEIHFNVILRRNAYLTLKNQVASGGSSLQVLRDCTRKVLNVRTSQSLSDHAIEILESAESVTSFPRALSEIYNLSNIVVSDLGSGMSIADLNKNFLVLGTPSRKRVVEQALNNGSSKAPFLGEKGIGRLSAMRIGNRLRVETARSSDSEINLLEIDWSEFASLDAMIEDIDVKPIQGGAKPTPVWSGTRIVMSDLAEDWTEQRVKDMVETEFARLTDPFLDQKQRPRIVIFWNDERLTIPWMEQKLLDHAHARMSGSYAIIDGKPQLSCQLEALDLGFKHPKETDRIVLSAPDLEGALIGISQNQNIHDDALVTTGPFKFEAHWFNRRRLGNIDGIGEMKVVRELQRKWSGVLLFRDGFRVFPYGEDEDDWLALDRRALGRGGYALNKTQFIGRVTISRAANPELVDQTNREGLRVTPEQQVLIGVLQYAINSLLLNFLKGVEEQYKSQKIDLSEAKTEITALEERAKTALKRLKKLAPKEGQGAVEDLQQTILEFTDFAERARQRITEVEQESRQMIEMAGVGLMIEVVAHELARASENALENLEILRKKAVPEEVKTALTALQAEMKSLSKRVRILDPLSVAGRQRTEIFCLDDLLREILDAHHAQFERHHIEVKLDLPKRPVRLKAVKGMIVQIIENLISNSKYWMQMRREREPNLRPTITIGIHDGPPTVIYEDNGRGISPENREKVFKAFFSLKEKSKRRGLGLFIARECAQFNGGRLFLDECRNAETGRLHRFTLEFPPNVSVQ